MHALHIDFLETIVNYIHLENDIILMHSCFIVIIHRFIFSSVALVDVLHLTLHIPAYLSEQSVPNSMLNLR